MTDDISFHPMVSIVIPVYNGSNFLREAIDSALGQSYDNIEVIVINDGSDDEGKTDAVARSYGNTIRYFSKENGGVATALNLGINNMRGEYFSWLSHDDVYYPHKISSQIEFIQRFELQDAIIYANYETIDINGIQTGIHQMPFTNIGEVCYKLYLNSWLHCCTLLIPKKFLSESDNFSEMYSTVQDYELFIKMAQKIPFIHQAEVVLKARQHAGQSSKKMKCHVQELKEFYNRHLTEVLIHIRKQSYRGDKAVLNALQEIVKFRIKQKLWSCAVRALLEMSKQPKGIRRTIKLGIEQTMPSFYQKLSKVEKTIKIFFGHDAPAGLEHKNKQGLSRLNFRQIYEDDGFLGGGESASGGGSTLWATRILRRDLPILLHQYGITSILDIPCGDFNWMRHVNLGCIKYIGADIVPDLIFSNQNKFGSKIRKFECLDLLEGPLPKTDLIFCRDCLVHMSYDDIRKALQVMKQSGAKWLLTTSFIERTENTNLSVTGMWRPLNLCRPPFNFTSPKALLNEKCVEGGGLFGDKHLCLWNIEEISLRNFQ